MGCPLCKALSLIFIFPEVSHLKITIQLSLQFGNLEETKEKEWSINDSSTLSEFFFADIVLMNNYFQGRYSHSLRLRNIIYDKEYN